MAGKEINKTLVVSEYPKSGGTWLTSLLGSTLNVPMRDLYLTAEKLNDPNQQFYRGMKNHPWYKNSAESVDFAGPCIVKSHELPDSPLLHFAADYIHLVRDGRDCVVSRYFYEKEFCVKNGLNDHFSKTFDETLEIIAHEWKNFILAWLDKNIPIVFYEKLLADPQHEMKQLLQTLSLSYKNNNLTHAIADNTVDKMRNKLNAVYQHNTFVRKAVVGDWQNHFSKKHLERFLSIAREPLLELGYIPSRSFVMVNHDRKVGQPFWNRLIQRAKLLFNRGNKHPNAQKNRGNESHNTPGHGNSHAVHNDIPTIEKT